MSDAVPQSHSSHAVLILSESKDDRRRVFDALDREGFEGIYTARNVARGKDIVSEQAELRLVFLDLEADGAGEFCDWLRDDENGQSIPVIGILAPEGGGMEWIDAEVQWPVVDLLYRPVNLEETLFRANRALSLANKLKQARGDDQPDTDAGDSVATAETEAGGDARGPMEQEEPDEAAGIWKERFETLFDGAGEELVFVDPKSGRIIAANRRFQERTGLIAALLKETEFFSLDLTHDGAQKRELADVLTREGQVSFECEMADAGGESRPLRVNITLGSFGDQLIYLCALKEIGVAREVRNGLSLLSKAFSAPLQDSGAVPVVEGVAAWLGLDYLLVASFDEDREESFHVLTAYCRGELDGDMTDSSREGPMRMVLKGEEVCAPSEAWSSLERNRFLVDNRIEAYIGIPLREQDGTVQGVLVAASRREIRSWEIGLETLRLLAGRFALGLELRQLSDESRHQGLHDSLTRLPNRLLFNDRLEQALREGQRTGEMFGVMFVDLDRFKTINDTLGHGVGDQVLLGIAERLRRCLRASDTVGRYAGDEFTVVLRHIVQREDVYRIADKVNEILSRPLQLDDGGELQVTASIGLSFYPDDGSTVEQLVKNADMAMYSAKGMGRNTFQTFVSVPEESHQQKLVLESKLRRAEDNNELRVFYQPQLAVGSEDIVGMEALIRWQHPELGLISPGFFIPLAEETGLIVNIGKWMIRNACEDAKYWGDRFGIPLRLGVNLSALQIRQTDLVDYVAQILKETALKPDLLDLEVTESIDVKTIPNLLEVLSGLQELGCSISIDDFGTGHSSLDYIKRFPADRIKIDQSFVRNIGVDPDDEAIIENTIRMAHSLKLHVTAEGVEQEEHLEFLRRHACEEVQGYLFCRPLPSERFEALLEERERLLQAS